MEAAAAAPVEPPAAAAVEESPAAAVEAAAAPPTRVPPPPPPAGGLTAGMVDKVVKQMEFYFSDSNLPRDKFMLEKVHESEEGFVDIGLIATFSRMRDILKARHDVARARPRGSCLARANSAPRRVGDAPVGLAPPAARTVRQGAQRSATRATTLTLSGPVACLRCARADDGAAHPASNRGCYCRRTARACAVAVRCVARRSALRAALRDVCRRAANSYVFRLLSHRHCWPVSEDGRRVRRAAALAPGAEDEINKAVEARSLYATPFPMNSTLDGAHACGAAAVQHCSGVACTAALLG
jgi:hypothetical protein